MNPQILATIDLINSVFTANGDQDITGTNSNETLLAIVNSLYAITGNPEYLNTEADTNLVEAINELKDLLGQVNEIRLFGGSQNPNTFEVNGGDYEMRDFYAQSGINGTFDFWIYTGVSGVEWLSLINPKSSVKMVSSLPSSGDPLLLYIRTSDNTQWRWQVGGSVQYPNPIWIQIGGSKTHTHKFTFNGSNRVQVTASPIGEIIDFQIGNSCNFDEYINFIEGESEFEFTGEDVLPETKMKLIYKSNS